MLEVTGGRNKFDGYRFVDGVVGENRDFTDCSPLFENRLRAAEASIPENKLLELSDEFA